MHSDSEPDIVDGSSIITISLEVCPKINNNFNKKKRNEGKYHIISFERLPNAAKVAPQLLNKSTKAVLT